MIIDQDTAEDFTPTVLLQKDGVKYYNDSDIPCISKDEYGYGTNVLISEERACSKKNVNNKLWMVCLVTNTIPKCLRCEEYSDGGMILNDPYHSVCSSWYKWNNPQKGDDYDTRCKKIAWGIAAYIGYCCWIDEDGELDWKNGTLEDLYREYHDEAIELAKRMNKAYSKAMRHKDNQTMQIIGDDIEEQHIQQEEAFIKQSSELENVLGKPVLDAAKEYLQWLQKDRNLNFVEMSNDGCKNLNLQPQQSKTTRRKGRPKSTFKDCMVNDEDGIRLKKIHSVMKGRIGKGAALVMLACIKKGWLIRPTYAQVKNEFGDIGSSSGYNKYLNEKMFTKDEIDGAINSLN